MKSLYFPALVKPSVDTWLRLHEKHQAGTTWPSHSQILSRWKLWEVINYCCFKPLSFGVICYAAIENRRTVFYSRILKHNSFEELCCLKQNNSAQKNFTEWSSNPNFFIHWRETETKQSQGTGRDRAKTGARLCYFMPSHLRRSDRYSGKKYLVWLIEKTGLSHVVFKASTKMS